MLRAVTYDFWQTLLWEEPGHLEEDRLSIWEVLLRERGLPVARQALKDAHAAAFAVASASWVEGVQFRADHAGRHVCETLGLVDDDLVASITAGFSTAGKGTLLHESTGLRETLETWRERGVKLAIVCDVGLTPSPVLLGHLEERGLLEFFDAWSFSDVTGVYKPHGMAFECVLSQLGVTAIEAAHVGDRTRTDIAGAQAIGMRAVRYAGIYDDPVVMPLADLVVTDHREVLGLGNTT